MRFLSILVLSLATFTFCAGADSLADMEKATDMNDAGSVFSLATWCRENKQDRKANTYMLKVIKLDPDHADARRALGQVKIGTRWVNEKDLKDKPSTAPAPAGKGPTFAEQKWDVPVMVDPDPGNDFALAYIAKLDAKDAEGNDMEVAINTLSSKDNRDSALPKLYAALAAGKVGRIYGPAQMTVGFVREGRRDLALRFFPLIMKASTGVTDPADCTALLGMMEVLRDKRGVPRLIELLSHSDADVKDNAALTATKLTGVSQPTAASVRTWWDRWHGRNDVDIWKDQLKSDSADIALGAAVILIDSREPAIMATITTYLKGPNVRETRLAIEALKKLTRQDWGMSPEASVEERTKKAAQIEVWWKEGKERFEWPESEGRTKEREAQAAVAATTPASDPLLPAVAGLAQTGAAASQAESRLLDAGPTAVPALISGLSDANLIIRRKSADLLARISKKTDIPFDPRAVETERAQAIAAWTAWAISQKLMIDPTLAEEDPPVEN